MVTITREIAERVRDIVDVGLSNGLGEPIPGQMCVEAAVCYALGLPHGDDPGCVSPAVRYLKIRLNDADWSSSQARAAGLRRLAIAQLGSKGAVDDGDFARRVAAIAIREIVPIALRAAAQCVPAHADTLEAAAIRCQQKRTEKAARAAASAAHAASTASAATYAADAAADAADAAAAFAFAFAAAAFAADAAAAAKTPAIETHAIALLDDLIALTDASPAPA